MNMHVKPIEQTPLTCGGYNAGHPWYYLLGGKVPTPKQIRADAVAQGYHGYMEERIIAVSQKPEPQRSEKLRQIKADIMRGLVEDISRYRNIALQLHRDRTAHGLEENPTCCNDIHTGMSLKYVHIYNGFGHLALLDSLLEQQGDLFDY